MEQIQMLERSHWSMAGFSDSLFKQRLRNKHWPSEASDCSVLQFLWGGEFTLKRLQNSRRCGKKTLEPLKKYMLFDRFLMSWNQNKIDPNDLPFVLSQMRQHVGNQTLRWAQWNWTECSSELWFHLCLSLISCMVLCQKDFIFEGSNFS